MPRQASEDSILVSAARVVGTTLGHVKRLTTEGAQASSGKRRSGGRTRRQDSSAKAQSGTSSTRQQRTARSSGQPRTRSARPRATNRPIAALEEPDMAAAHAGASRSPRQTESRRGKSRSKRSKSRRASPRS